MPDFSEEPNCPSFRHWERAYVCLEGFDSEGIMDEVCSSLRYIIDIVIGFPLTKCDGAGLFPLIVKIGADRRGKIPDISLIAGKKFRNWVVKDLDPFSQDVPTVKKRCRNIVLSFSHDSVTTARLKTYNVHRVIGTQRARDQISRDRQRRPKNKRSKKELGGERREVYKESERARRRGFEGAV
ncbi:hypothetical protein TNCV_2374371 [Trichonephila clavipes]|nr:hypothetical protein TNCV_2374371 [Trichonephila clavipes]